MPEAIDSVVSLRRHLRVGGLVLALFGGGLAVVSARLDELGVRRARLLVERDGGDGLVLPQTLAARADEPALAEIVRGEERLLRLRREAQTSRIAQLEEQIVQLEQEVAGLEAQAVAKTREREMVERELKGVRDLFARGLVPLTRLAGLERDDARIEAEAASLRTAAAQARGRIGETRLAILQTVQEARSEAARQLRETEALAAEETERAVAARDALDRIVLRAPRAGTVHRLAVHTVGGVVGPGEVLMTLVPRNDELAVEIRVTPTDIDRVALGLPVVLRFSAFDQRTTPEVTGTVTRVSPDVITDGRTGLGAYIARVRLDTAAEAVLADRALVPGMPVEAFVRTGERTLFAHLTKPFSDHMIRAFRQD